jgi:hypothetical protein
VKEGLGVTHGVIHGIVGVPGLAQMFEARKRVFHPFKDKDTQEIFQGRFVKAWTGKFSSGPARS